MTGTFYALIFLPLAIVVGLIVGGLYLHTGVGAIMVGIGIIGAVFWILFAFYLASELNSDI